MDGDVIAFLLLADETVRPSVICGKARLTFAADGAIDGRSDTLNCIPPVYFKTYIIYTYIHIYSINYNKNLYIT